MSQNPNKNLRQSYEELQAAVINSSQAILALRQAIANNAEVLSAIVSLLGEQTVSAEMRRIAQERQAAEDAQKIAGVAEMVKVGVFQPVPETIVGAVVIGTDALPDGRAHRFQFELRSPPMSPEAMERFTGKKVGDVVDFNDVKATITEIYVIDHARVASYQAEQTAKAQEAMLAAQQAASPVETKS